MQPTRFIAWTEVGLDSWRLLQCLQPLSVLVWRLLQPPLAAAALVLWRLRTRHHNVAVLGASAVPAVFGVPDFTGEAKANVQASTADDAKAGVPDFSGEAKANVQPSAVDEAEARVDAILQMRGQQPKLEFSRMENCRHSTCQKCKGKACTICALVNNCKISPHSSRTDLAVQDVVQTLQKVFALHKLQTVCCGCFYVLSTCLLYVVCMVVRYLTLTIVCFLAVANVYYMFGCMI